MKKILILIIANLLVVGCSASKESAVEGCGKSGFTKVTCTCLVNAFEKNFFESENDMLLKMFADSPPLLTQSNRFKISMSGMRDELCMSLSQCRVNPKSVDPNLNCY